MLSFNEGITFGFDRYIDINIYIYGLFIEGCQWNDQLKILDE